MILHISRKGTNEPSFKNTTIMHYREFKCYVKGEQTVYALDTVYLESRQRMMKWCCYKGLVGESKAILEKKTFILSRLLRAIMSE